MLKTRKAMNHKPEPGKMQLGSVINGEGRLIYFFAGIDDQADDRAEHEANARRIVACVNYCAGWSTEYIELHTRRNRP